MKVSDEQRTELIALIKSFNIKDCSVSIQIKDKEETFIDTYIT